MKAKSAKNKGNRFEYYLRDRFRADICADTRKNLMSGAGYDKGDLRIPSHNIVVEAKNQAQINLLNWWEQTKVQALAGDTTILAIRHPKKAEFHETLIVMDLEYFISLLQNSTEEREVEYKMDYSKLRVLDDLKRAIQRAQNEFKD